MRFRAIRRLAVQALLALTCSHVATPHCAVGAELRPAEPLRQDTQTQVDQDSNASSDSQAAPSNGLRIIGLTPQTPPWFLERMRRLLHDGRADDAHSLAEEALSLFPDSDELKLGAAFAARAAGRCTQADSYLRQLDEDSLAPALRNRATYLRVACHGPWRRHLRIDAIIGYRPSLVDRARDPVIRLQQGSALYRLCARLRLICNPDRSFRSRTPRDGGIDFWYGLTLVNRYRAGTAWDLDVETMLFWRRPFRSGFDGQAAMLRLTATHQNSAARKLSLFVEPGLSRFQQGRADLTVSQRHFRTRLGLTAAHSATRRSHVGLSRLTAKSQWLNLARDRLTYHHEFGVGSKLTPWLGFALERKRQSGVTPVPDARAREGLFGLRWKGKLGALHLRHIRRSERSRRLLAFLAAPHRASTRLTGLDLVPMIGHETSNLKVVLSFEYRKISTPDPYRLRSSRTLILRLSYDAFKP